MLAVCALLLSVVFVRWVGVGVRRSGHVERGLDAGSVCLLARDGPLRAGVGGAAQLCVTFLLLVDQVRDLRGTEPILPLLMKGQVPCFIPRTRRQVASVVAPPSVTTSVVAGLC